MIGLAALALVAVQDAPTYVQALRCGGLTLIEAARLDVNAPAHAATFDASAEWHMAVVHIVTAQGIPNERYGEDLEAAREKARADLTTGSAAVRAELAACIATAPPIPR